ncbi:MAG TPA: lysylphosphatidylglycerol synthase domain-containing protein [Steroidobacteraceae bacterium]|nr:lysylphosphatidylglycerol synthase domain-containing protein [Steroidobacteraceae bacterium]
MQDPDDLSEEPKSSAPSASSRLQLLIVVALGVALIGYLLRHIGLHAVLAAAGSIGLGGFGLLCVMAFVVFALVGSAWYVLLPPTTHASLPVIIWARMVRDAVSESLPLSPVGGMILGVRAAGLFGMATRLTVASLIVDVTAELIAQVLYVGVGLSLLLTRGTHGAAAVSLERGILIGIGVLSLCGIGMLALQRRGIGWLSGKLAARVFPASGAHMSGVAADLREIHRSPLRLLLSTGLHFCAWVAAALSTWVAFRLIGERVDISAVIALESLVYAARSLAFFVPNALGVQEAAYTVLAPLFGIGKEFALAVSLLRRARDIAVGIPILLVYQLLEGRRALARRVQT